MGDEDLQDRRAKVQRGYAVGNGRCAGDCARVIALRDAGVVSFGAMRLFARMAGWRGTAGAAAGLLVAGLLAGCGSGITAGAFATGGGGGTGTGGAGGGGGTGTAGVAGVGFRGVVTAAGKPVVGATVQVYAAGTTGVGGGATVLESAALTTDATGAFSVAAGYTCPAAATQVYVVARGGTVGAAAGANATLAEMVVLGPCGALASGSSVVVDEATTVAGVWAMQQFLAANGMVGASATNGTGLANASAMAQALVNTGTRTAPGVGFVRSATVPVAKLNTLANLLSVCTADGNSAACASVMAAVTGSGAAAPADTLALALAVAKAPAANVAALYSAANGGAVFSPVLTTAPLDWMLTLTYTGGGLMAVDGPTALAIDGNGDAWVANYGGVVSAFSPVGVPLFPSGITGGGLNSSYALAIDGSNNVWVTNGASGSGGSVAEISTAGQFLSGVSGYGGSFAAPVGIAIDPNGTVWVVNTENATVTQLNSSGQVISGAGGYGSSALAFPGAIAIDGSHNAWVGDMNGQQVVRISADGRTVTPVTCCNGPQGLAIDAAGYVWAANYYGDSVSRIAGGGAVASGSPYTGATLRYPSAIAVDGAGSVWVGNFRGNLLTQLAGSSAARPGAVLSPAAGWASDAGLNQPFAAAVDASGDVWVSNFAAGTVTELVGVAAPVRTPLLGPVVVP